MGEFMGDGMKTTTRRGKTTKVTFGYISLGHRSGFEKMKNWAKSGQLKLC